MRQSGNVYASAISEHPVAAHAVGELAGSVLEQLEGRRADLLVVFVSPHFAGAAEDVGGVLRAVLEPRSLIGSTHAAVVGTGREVEATPAISVFAAAFAETSVSTVRLTVDQRPDGAGLVGWPGAIDDAHTLVLLADPFTFPTEGVLHALGASHPSLQVIGGMASAANGPGGNRLLHDHQVFTDGAVGVLVRGPNPVECVVSQGCRPVGQPFTVTDVEDNYLRGLGGRPTLERLQEIALELPDAEREQLQHGVQVGIVVDEHIIDFDRGDFLIRSVLGARADDGALSIGARLEIGQTVQFHLRDAISADADLRQLLGARTGAGALLFSCTGRGEHFFGVANHDAAVVADLLGPIPTAGGFCAGEVGPIGLANHLHGFTAAVAIFS